MRCRRRCDVVFSVLRHGDAPCSLAAWFRLLALHGAAAGGWWGAQASKLAQCMLVAATSAASSGGDKGGGGRDGNGQGRAKLGGGATAGEPFDMFAASHFQMDTGWHVSKSIFANFRMVCAARVVGPGCSSWLFPLNFMQRVLWLRTPRPSSSVRSKRTGS